MFAERIWPASRKFVLPDLLFYALYLLTLVLSAARADQVIMKDGTVYKGKILIDTDKAILIGNPPFDPNSYLLQSEDIEKVIYEEYHPNPPAERKRGLTFEGRLNGQVTSSDQLDTGPAPSLYAGVGFRVHPFFELNGGLDWMPFAHAGDPFTVINGTTTEATTRQYQDFWQYSAVFSARFYPFYKQKWKDEPYLVAGYSWSHEMPKGSGDSLKGLGWHIGFGAIRPLTTHIFLEGRFIYQKMTYDTIHFLGQEGNIDPNVVQHNYSVSIGASYRL
jgi:hypothetical protein